MKYINLIQRRLQGKLAGTDKQALDEWLDTDVANQKEAAAYEQTWQKAGQYEPIFQPDVEAGLSKLQARMAAAKRAEVPQAKVVQMPARRRWLSIAAAAAILVVAGWFWQNSVGNSAWTTIQTAYDEQIEVTLPDGSIAYLNENSELAYTDFEGEERGLKLTGQAFFEVTKNPNQPFVIHTNDASVTVLGTSFDVRAIAEEPTTEVTVRTGKVAFQPTTKAKANILTKGDKAIYTKANKQVNVVKDLTMNALAWRSKQLKFEEATLQNIATDLGRAYHVEIVIENAAVKTCRQSGTVQTNRLTLENALAPYMEVFQLGLKKEAGKYILTGGQCK